MRLRLLVLLTALAWGCSSSQPVGTAEPQSTIAPVAGSGERESPVPEPDEPEPEPQASPQALQPELAADRVAELSAPIDSDDSWVEALLLADPLLAELAGAAEELRMQIVIGEIDRSSGTPDVRFHPFRLEADYFYPASAIKTLGAVGALQVFAELRAAHPWLDLDTPIEFGARQTTLTDVRGERVTVSEQERTTLRRELERTLVVSSNEGFNRLWDIAGHEGINQRAWDAGLHSVRMRHRLSRQGIPEAAQRMTPSLRAELDGAWLEVLPERDSSLDVPDNAHDDVRVGVAHVAPLSDEQIDEPLDFSVKNATSLMDMLALVAWIADPALVPHVHLGLLPEDRQVLLEIMGRVQDEPERFKPFSPGILQNRSFETIRYVNKAGRAYGFHLDAAYIRDESSGAEFLLAAAIHTNPNGVMNDSRYGYDDVSFPFLVALGAAVAERLLP